MIKLDKWSKDKLHAGIRKHSQHIREILKANKPLEAVSINLIQDLLIDAFGYQRDWLLPQENISNKHVDLAIQHPGATIMCEGKKYNASKSQLNEDAQKQLDLYCRANVCEWGILTDGIRWEFYWYPFGKTKKDRQKFAEVDFMDLPDRITQQYCEKFHIFHAKIAAKFRRNYADIQNTISTENIIVCLRQKEVFKTLCKVIQKKLNKSLPEVNKLTPRIYACFTQILPLPEGRNNPYDPNKQKKQRRNKKINVKVQDQASEFTQQQITEQDVL
ncbi:MAG: hypothetical protein IJ876_04830 [Elusimicrobiaceae bacterium]|nr:hypothetical protein [Elusimicrobiaceae bacterium]